MGNDIRAAWPRGRLDRLRDLAAETDDVPADHLVVGIEQERSLKVGNRLILLAAVLMRNAAQEIFALRIFRETDPAGQVGNRVRIVLSRDIDRAALAEIIRVLRI